MNRRLEMKKLNNELMSFCDSELSNDRRKNGTLPVLGEGNLYANIMFIGEAPGKKESETGRPFCGASGKLLNELLAHIKLDRDSVYVTNIVKDRPPKNRDPKPDEIDKYASFLDRQIEIIQPRVLATLGRFSMEYIMTRYGLESKIDTISNIHGEIFSTTINKNEVKIIPLFHPAVAIYNRKRLPELKQDFTHLRSLI